jgi:hypothetical protein|tara:strand:- start:1400 stop:1639 length:240 start_codon:yes stop_codon:yes gene_type:complete
MIQMDRETLMMVATIVAVAGVIFLFREMNKTKEDVDNLKNFSAQLVQKLSAPPPVTHQQVEQDVTTEEEVITTEEKSKE